MKEKYRIVEVYAMPIHTDGVTGFANMDNVNTWTELPTYKITLMTVGGLHGEDPKKLVDIMYSDTYVKLISEEYHDLINFYKKEFIEFMEQKHPGKISKDPKAWDLFTKQQA